MRQSRARLLTWARSRRWRRPRCIVTESASEFGHWPAAAVKSASSNMHGIEARHRRRGVEDEVNRHVAICYGSRVSRNPVHGKIACINGCWVHCPIHVEIEISRRGSNNAPAACAAHRTTRLGSRCRCGRSRRGWLTIEERILLGDTVDRHTPVHP